MQPHESVPATYRAYVVEHRDDDVARGVRERSVAELSEGEVTIAVEWSSVNFKDGLAVRRDGRVARTSPLVPGIDLAGRIVASDDAGLPIGRGVLAHGYDLGTAHDGGYAELARVPVGWVVPLPAALSARDAMAIGTAGFTAALSLIALEDRGLRPGDGPVLVTGASGGLGRIAVELLARRGHEVHAVTGKADQAARLLELGAAEVVDRAFISGLGNRPLESARWAGAIDTVGAPTLPSVLRTLRQGAAVAACGNAGGASFETTVLPFILRGVALLGIDSAWTPIDRRRAIWARLADAGDLRPVGLADDITEVGLGAGLDEALDAIVAGRAAGRWIVRVGAGSAAE
ncbi:MAG TPA: acryloyl-CoA reductase [Candidatus Limnocylindrales bacterium]|nr:acryloyl-CoA reductase [Candidatus Limnocylindrales bacterium]